MYLLILLGDIFAQENSQRTDIEKQLQSKQKEKECLEQQLANKVLKVAQLRLEIQKVNFTSFGIIIFIVNIIIIYKGKIADDISTAAATVRAEREGMSETANNN